MAVDKLVDSAQLDADLTSVADAIRTKGGTSAQLAFPEGFVSAVEAIPTGGGTPSNVLVTFKNGSSSSIGINTPNYNSTYNVILMTSCNAATISAGNTNTRNVLEQDGKIAFMANVAIKSASYDDQSLPLSTGGSGANRIAIITLPTNFDNTIPIVITR